MATARIYRTFGTPTNLDKWTVSAWVKRGGIGDSQYIFQGWNASTTYTSLRFGTDNKLDFNNRTSGTYNGQLITNRVFRDPTAWYHIVAVWDADNATPGDRMKIYVNGDEGSYAVDTNPTSGQASYVASGDVCNIGVNNVSSDMFDGCMSWVQFVDGAALAATDFGSVDGTSGIWKIKPAAYGTPGTNGFTLAMEDRTNLDLDTSSNAHTFTTGGTLSPTKDTPSNNFCTFNPVVGEGTNRSGFTWSNGNNKVVTPGSSGSGSTMGFSAGKWYYEVLIDTLGNFYGGWQDLAHYKTDESYFVAYGGVAMNNSPDIYYNLTSATSTGYKGVSSVAASSYYGFAFDFPNLKCWWSENGQWYTANSGTASTLTRAEVTSNTSGFDCTTGSTMSADSVVAPYMGCSTSATTNSFNFGNGVFGSTVLTGTTYADDAGEGVFKYEPPDGFRALCTNNIKLYGG